MIIYTEKIEIKAVFKLKYRFQFFFAHSIKIHIILSRNVSYTGIIFPIHPSVNGNILFFRDHGFKSFYRLLFSLF